MKKLNNKGFMMAEVLAVSVVVLVLFGFIYANFMPTKGEYEKRINYNDVNSQYAIFYMRKHYIDEGIIVNDDEYIILYDGEECNNISSTTETLECTKLAKSLGIEELIVTKYRLTKNFKDNYTGKLENYIGYLPEYKDYNLSDEAYRLIIKTKHGYATTALKIRSINNEE